MSNLLRCVFDSSAGLFRLWLSDSVNSTVVCILGSVVIYIMRPSVFRSLVCRCVGCEFVLVHVKCTLVWLLLFCGTELGLSHLRPRGFSVIVASSGDKTNLLSHSLTHSMFLLSPSCLYLSLSFMLSHSCTCKHIKAFNQPRWNIFFSFIGLFFFS